MESQNFILKKEMKVLVLLFHADKFIFNAVVSVVYR